VLIGLKEGGVLQAPGVRAALATALFREVVVTDVVLADVLTGRYPDTEAPIHQALAAGWLRAVALDRSEPALLLIDERAGRAVARELGLSVAGTAAVIGLARQRGLIASARDVFAARSRWPAARRRLQPWLLWRAPGPDLL